MTRLYTGWMQSLGSLDATSTEEFEDALRDPMGLFKTGMLEGFGQMFDEGVVTGVRADVASLFTS